MFYTLNSSVEKGKSAIIERVDPYHFELENNQGDLSIYKFPDAEPVFSNIYLKRGSVMTDFIEATGTIAGKGFMISERVKSIFADYTLPDHRFYKLPTYTKSNKAYQYFWMQILIPDNNYDWIDFNKSTFLKTDFFGDNAEEIKYDSRVDLELAFATLDDLQENIFEGEIFLNESFKGINPDMFYFKNLFNSRIIVNEKIKNDLLNEKVTGIENFFENSVDLFL